ncbi:MAG: HAD hydrolase-like protein [Candidatus Buchananbacteria bacterium]|nr:HAD hydrolase-like protein [Candidatus Buchananbacteria bacterium]
MIRRKIKLVILDGNGIILSRGYPDTVKALAQKFKISEELLHQVLYKKYFNQAAERKISQKKAWQKSVEDLKLPISWQKLRDWHLGLLKINEPAFEFAKKIRREYKTIILSKNTRSQMIVIKKRFPQIWSSFDAVINTWELGLPKASKATILLLAQRFKVKPDEIIYADDQKNNLVEAKKMGVKVIYYQNLSQFKKEFYKVLEK